MENLHRWTIKRHDRAARVALLVLVIAFAAGVVTVGSAVRVTYVEARQ